MIEAYKNPPSAYALDIGYLLSVEKVDQYFFENNGNVRSRKNFWRSGKLSLVEVSSICMGNFGISNENYAKMIEARWNDYMKEKGV